jgi:hypothetical protein
VEVKIYKRKVKEQVNKDLDAKIVVVLLQKGLYIKKLLHMKNLIRSAPVAEALT